MSLNPGYKVTAKRNKDDLPGNPGQKFLCPICQHIILEATTEKFTIKCKHCGHWVYAEKVAAQIINIPNDNKVNIIKNNA